MLVAWSITRWRLGRQAGSSARKTHGNQIRTASNKDQLELLAHTMQGHMCQGCAWGATGHTSLLGAIHWC